VLISINLLFYVAYHISDLNGTRSFQLLMGFKRG